MALKENKYYWRISLKKPEPVADKYYVFDKIIILDKKLIKKIETLRQLIIGYCVVRNKNKTAADAILDEIYDIVTSVDKIQYTEFIAFWKAIDMSHSIFMKFPTQDVRKFVLEGILKKYCERRRKLYDKLGYSDITVQALYDSGASRKKGSAGIKKLINLIQKIFGNPPHVNNFSSLINTRVGYFLPDKGDRKLFRKFCNEFKVEYKFGKDHQGKEPDMVFKADSHFFIIEAKHIKESGGAQDKQIVEIIEFIKYAENANNIHYLSFMDGVYFNNFILIKNNADIKISRQKKAIERYIDRNKNNFFVNTHGLITLLRDISKEVGKK